MLLLGVIILLLFPELSLWLPAVLGILWYKAFLLQVCIQSYAIHFREIVVSANISNVGGVLWVKQSLKKYFRRQLAKRTQKLMMFWLQMFRRWWLEAISKPKNSGVFLAIQYRGKRKRSEIQDGRKLRRYRKRWIIERPFGWLGNYCRLLVRYKRPNDMYRAFFDLACIMIFLNRFWNASMSVRIDSHECSIPNSFHLRRPRLRFPRAVFS